MSRNTRTDRDGCGMADAAWLAVRALIVVAVMLGGAWLIGAVITACGGAPA